MTAPLVVLLHGLARRHTSLTRLDAHLRAAGFETWARSYPSRDRSIPELAAALADELAPIAGDRPLFAVTHSLGGVIVRHLADPRLHWQRIVMLAPPNQGSQLAARLAHKPLYRWFYGPAGQALAAAASSAPAAWPDSPAPFAVIAGTRSRSLLNPTSWTLGHRFGAGVANDGTVAVDETRHPKMSAFAEVDATHTWIMNDPHVQALVVRYLHDGRF